MKIYIASHDRWAGLYAGSVLGKLGFDIISNWLYEPFLRTEQYSDNDRIDIAVRDVEQVRDCDIVLLIAQDDKVPGGKFVEMGIALGLHKKTFLLGRKENMLMWHPDIIQIDEPYQILEHIEANNAD